MSPSKTSTQGQYLLRAKDFSTRKVPLPPPGPGEVQLAPRSTTLCGSDLHYHGHGRNGNITMKEPLCLGHETAAEVIAVGTDACGLQVGDKVAIECGVPCSKCDLCNEGKYNLCPKLRFRGSGAAFPHFQGSLQEKINHPAQWTHKLPPLLTYDDGALLEPLAVAVHAARRASVNSQSSCLVIGAGAVGLLSAAVARSKGCSRILICDIDQRRIEFALREGFADAAFVEPRVKPNGIDDQLEHARQLASTIEELKWRNGTPVGKSSVTFECTGVPTCVQMSIYATRSGGRVMLVGMGTPNHTLPLSEAGAREIDLLPTWRYANCYEEAIDFMTQVTQNTARPDIRKLITHRILGLDSVPDAFSLAGSSQDRAGNLVIKVVINT